MHHDLKPMSIPVPVEGCPVNCQADENVAESGGLNRSQYWPLIAMPKRHAEHGDCDGPQDFLHCTQNVPSVAVNLLT